MKIIDVYHHPDIGDWVVEKDGTIVDRAEDREEAVQYAEREAMEDMPSQVYVLSNKGHTFDYRIEYGVKHTSKPMGL